MDEKRSLLLSSGSSEEEVVGEGKYGTDHTTPPTDCQVPPTDIGPAVRPKHAWWRREKKLQRSPSLDKVDEDDTGEKKDDLSKTRGSMSRLFGVKSYLHNFYEGHMAKDPSVYEDDDFGYLGRPRHRRCTSIWWKVFVWIGANFLIFGIIGILVGYLVPDKPPFVGKISEHVYLQDRSAEAYNQNLAVCKLVGLILFCIGGLTLAVALLFPSFLYDYCDDDRRDSSFKVLLGEKEARSPLEMQIPASSLISGVQPDRKEKEAILTKEGMVTYSQ